MTDSPTLDPLSAANRIYLHPADLRVLTEPCEVMTVLGPCVSVTLWCPESAVAAICHAMLPKAPESVLSAGSRHPGKYVDEAIPELLARWKQAGGNPRSVEVKLFGGAEINAVRGFPGNIGTQNVARAREVLRELGLNLAAYDVGGPVGRKLIFDTRSGSVRVKRLGGGTTQA